MTRAIRRHRSTRLAVVALALGVSLLASACSDGHTDVRANASAGWSSYGGNSANANFAYPSVPADLELSWSREVNAPITAPLVVNGGGDVAVSAAAPIGCTFQVFDRRAGRKNFCKRLGDGSAGNAALYDQLGQPYIGEAGTFFAFNGGGAIRWRFPTLGLAQSAVFAGPARVLTATTQGQVLLLNAQTGQLAAPEVRLRTDVTPTDPTAGLADCRTGRAACGISAPPAADPHAKRVYLNFFGQGASGAELKAMRYADDKGNDVITDAWTAPIGGGMMGPPSLSADGKTVYAFGRDGTLNAVNAETGAIRWTHQLGGHGFATLSVAPDGTLVPAGELGGPLTILRDTGKDAEVVATRTDVATAGLGTQTTDGTVWTVVRGADKQLVLTEFDVKTAKTKRSLPLPGATGFATGVAVSATGQLAVASSSGTVFYFAAAS